MRQQAERVNGVPWWAAFVVAGFVSAGAFKGTDVVTRLPVDLTLALGSVTALLVLARSVERVSRDVVRVLYGFLLLAVPALWTQPTAYSDLKMGKLFTFTMLAGIAPAMLVRSRQDVMRLLFAGAALSAASVIGVLVAPQASSSYPGAPVVALGDNTISTASGAGFVLIVVSLGVIWRKVPWLLGLPVVGAAAYALLQTGSRGPLLATVAAVAVTVLLARDRPALPRAAVLIGLGAALVGELFALAPQASRDRILSLLHGQVSGDTQTRVQLFGDAWHSVVTTPAGVGWGGFEHLNDLGYRYPHNLPLEVLCEAGVVCGGLFLLWLVTQVVRVRDVRAGFTGSVVLAIVVSALLESLVSGDLNDDKTLFFSLGLGMALATLGQEQVARVPFARRLARPLPARRAVLAQRS